MEKQKRNAEHESWLKRLNKIRTALPGQVPSGIQLFLLISRVEENRVAEPDFKAFLSTVSDRAAYFHLPDGFSTMESGVQPKLITGCLMPLGLSTEESKGLSGMPDYTPCWLGISGASDGANLIARIREGSPQLLKMRQLGIKARGLPSDQPQFVEVHNPPHSIEPKQAVTISGGHVCVCDPADQCQWHLFLVWPLAIKPGKIAPAERRLLARQLDTTVQKLNYLIWSQDAPESLSAEMTHFRMWPWPLALVYLAATRSQPFLNARLTDLSGTLTKDSVRADFVIGFDCDLLTASLYGLDVLEELALKQQDSGTVQAAAASSGTGADMDSDGDWSKPMSKQRMMMALDIDSRPTFNSFVQRHGIREAGNRQTWQLNMTSLSRKERQKLEKG